MSSTRHRVGCPCIIHAVCARLLGHQTPFIVVTFERSRQALRDEAVRVPNTLLI